MDKSKLISVKGDLMLDGEELLGSVLSFCIEKTNKYPDLCRQHGDANVVLNTFIDATAFILSMDISALSKINPTQFGNLIKGKAIAYNQRNNS